MLKQSIPSEVKNPYLKSSLKKVVDIINNYSNCDLALLYIDVIEEEDIIPFSLKVQVEDIEFINKELMKYKPIEHKIIQISNKILALEKVKRILIKHMKTKYVDNTLRPFDLRKSLEDYIKIVRTPQCFSVYDEHLNQIEAQIKYFSIKVDIKEIEFLGEQLEISEYISYETGRNFYINKYIRKAIECLHKYYVPTIPNKV